MGDTLLEIRGLAKHYGSIRALDGIDLSVDAGCIYGFIGPNGAGKTTTIRILAGLIRPSAGQVHLAGQNLQADRTRAAQGLRTLVEVPSFYSGLSGRENLQIFARLARADPADVARLLSAVGLTEAADRPVGGYSLGMRQRLGIAQALVGRPRLVVLDEPMNGLDPAAIHLVRELLRTEREQHGVTFLLSSHLLHDVETLCDQVGIIHRGSMVAEGALADLLADAGPAGYRIETQNDQLALRALQEACRHAKPRIAPNGGLRVDGEEALLPSVHRVLLQVGVPAITLVRVRASLEDYFIEKTQGVMG